MQDTTGLPKERVKAIVKRLDGYMQTLERRIKELPEAPIKRDAMRSKQRAQALRKFWCDELLRLSRLKTEQ